MSKHTRQTTGDTLRIKRGKQTGQNKTGSTENRWEIHRAGEREAGRQEMQKSSGKWVGNKDKKQVENRWKNNIKGVNQKRVEKVN